jgi:zinc ribbon protein
LAWKEPAVLCNKCAADLPDDSQFCLKCGQPVVSPAKSAAVTDRSNEDRSDEDRPDVVGVHPPEPRRPRIKRRALVFFLLAILLLGLIVLVAASDNPLAQQIQEIVGWKHDHTILDTTFSIGPHTFRYYKFVLPQGSVNVAAMGQFGAAAESQKVGNREEKDTDKKNDKSDQNKDADNNIEVYVLTEAAFTVWQSGHATSSLYESGKVAEGAVQAEIPAGAGVYYLVFSNKSSPQTAKTVHATVLLRYKTWLRRALTRHN